MTFVKLEDVLAIVEKNAEGMSWSENPRESGAGFELLKRAQALRSLPTDDGVTDEMVERAAISICHSDGYNPHLRYDGENPRWHLNKPKARAALEAALGPLPAPPSD